MMSFQGLVLPALFGALALSIAPKASALSCADRTFHAPDETSTDIPIDTLVWCGHGNFFNEPRAPFLKKEGQDVPFSQSALEGSSSTLWIIDPDDDLEPNTEYTAGCGDEEWTFTTSDTMGASMPDVPTVQVAEAVALEDDDWGDSLYLKFPPPAANTIVVFDLNGEADLNESSLTGSILDAFTRETRGSPTIGSGLCYGNYNAELGESVEVRAAAFNLTGEFSGWSETVTAKFPEKLEKDSDSDGEPDSGCSYSAQLPAQGSSALWTLLALIGVQLVRRRLPSAK